MRVTRRRLFWIATLALAAPSFAFAQANNKKKPPARKTVRRRKSSPRSSSKKPASQPATPPPKWPDDEIQTVAAAVARLREVPPKDLPASELARHASLEFALSLGQTDGAVAAQWVEAVGFQALPYEGPLPEEPGRAILPEVLGRHVQTRTATDVGAAALKNFVVADRDAVRATLPHVAQWMLPSDMLVWIEPDARIAHWVTRREFLVIRLRGRRATIAGGSLFSD